MNDVFQPLEEWLRLIHSSTAVLGVLYLGGYAMSRRGQRGRSRSLLRGARALPLLGLSVAMASPSLARPRGHRPSGPIQLTPTPPWSGSIGYPPPRLLVRTEAAPSSPGPTAHPGIHGRLSASRRGTERLFMRAGQPSGDDGGRREAMRRHPSGNKRIAATGVCGDRYVVAPGDALWSIAARALGTDEPRRVARYWPRIHRVNRAVIGSDPSLIYPGQVLRLPPECGD